MNKEQAIAHFGSPTELARALGIDPAAVSQWGETVPILRQLQIEELTKKALKASPQWRKSSRRRNPRDEKE